MLPRLSDVERSIILRSVFAVGSALAYLLFQIQNPIHPLLWMDVTTPGVRLYLCGDGGDGGDGGGWGGGKETHVV